MAKRIEYIDLMKGISIVAVVIFHCMVPSLRNVVMSIAIPSFFFVSGLFFKEYGGFKDFFVRKVNSLVVPYLFFTYITVLLLLFTDLKGKSILYYALQFIEPHNYALWFFKSLFVTYILYFIFNRLTRKCNELTKVLILVVLTFATWYSTRYLHAFREPMRPYLAFYICICNLFTSIMVLPLFHLAHYAKNHCFLERQFSCKLLFPLMIVTGVINYFTSNPIIDFREAIYLPNYLVMYLNVITGIVFLWSICYMVKRLPVFSYLGRNSLIVFGMHVPYIILYKSLISNELLGGGGVCRRCTRTYASHYMATQEVLPSLCRPKTIVQIF